MIRLSAGINKRKKNVGKDDLYMIYTTHYASPLGDLLLAENENQLIGLWLEGQKYYCGSLREAAQERSDRAVFAQTADWLDRYFAGEQPAVCELSLAPRGSAFRQAVWKILCKIPYGEVTTYGEIARQLARQSGLTAMSGQAVGGAVGHNPISIIIPCHRVVGTNGSLTGYAGGSEKKIQLLQREGVDVSRFSIPKKGTAL